MSELRLFEEPRVIAEKMLSQHHPKSEWAARGRNEPLAPRDAEAEVAEHEV